MSRGRQKLECVKSTGGCGRVFTGSQIFGRHFVKREDGRCMTTRELRKIGAVRGDDGAWSSAPPSPRRTLFDLRSRDLRPTKEAIATVGGSTQSDADPKGAYPVGVGRQRRSQGKVRGGSR